MDESVAPISGPDKLKQIATQIKSGQPPEAVTVRELLRWFNAQRRGSWNVSWIRKSLSDADLVTDPDFEGTWIDGLIRFVPAAAQAIQPPAPFQDAVSLAALQASREIADPTYRIGKLQSANTPPVSVTPNHTITEAITIMLANDFSQLPVMTSERDVKASSVGHLSGVASPSGRNAEKCATAWNRRMKSAPTDPYLK